MYGCPRLTLLANCGTWRIVGSPSGCGQYLATFWKYDIKFFTFERHRPLKM